MRGYSCLTATSRPSRTSAPDIEVNIESLQIASNKGWIGVDGGTATLRSGAKDWQLSQVVGTVQLGLPGRRMVSLSMRRTT